MHADAPPTDTPLTLEEARRTAEPDRTAGTPLSLCDDPDVTFTLSPVGLTVHGECGVNEWAQAFGRIRERSESLLWAIGDLAVYGVAQFGDAARRVIEASEYAERSVQLAAYVCAKFPIEARFPELSIYHHNAVAGLPMSKAKKQLQDAVTNGTSVRALLATVRAGTVGLPDAPDPVLALTRPASRLQRALTSLDADERARLSTLAAAHGIPFQGDRWPAMEAVIGVLSELKAG